MSHREHECCRAATPTARLRGLWTTLVLASTLAACTRDPKPPGKRAEEPGLVAATVRDSAGIRLISYPTLGPPRTALGSGAWFGTPGWGAVPNAFVVDSTPFIDFGGRDNSMELKDPFFSAAISLPTGAFVLADGDRLLQVDSAGNLLAQAGRRGQGPAEFTDIETICLLGNDSIVVVDKLRRVSLWSAALEHMQTRKIFGTIYPASCNRRGQFLMANGPVATQMTPDGSESRVAYSLVDFNGVTTMRLGTFSGAQRAGTMFWLPRFVWLDDELVEADARRFELSWRTSSGRVRQLVRLVKPDEKLSADQWHEFSARAVPRNSSDENRRRVLTLMGPAPNASLPPHGGLRIDPDGRVWVANHRDQTHWTVFARDGSLIGRVTLRGLSGSPLIAVIEVGRDFIQVREPDQDGFTHLRFYRIRPTRR